jgi:hypothetical protein
VDSVLWNPPELDALRGLTEFFGEFFRDGRLDDWDLSADRFLAFQRMDAHSKSIHKELADRIKEGEDRFLGLALGKKAPKSIRRSNGRPVFEIPKLRPCRRIGPDGQQRTEAVLEIVQRRKAFFDEGIQSDLESGKIPYDEAKPDFYFRGGCTLLVDPKTGAIRYCIRKSIHHPNQVEHRLIQERRFRAGDFGDGAGGAYLSPAGTKQCNPFAFLHSSY